MKNEKTELKDKIKRLRKEKGLTQEEFAKTLFVSRSAVAKWENGLGLPTWGLRDLH